METKGWVRVLAVFLAAVLVCVSLCGPHLCTHPCCARHPGHCDSSADRDLTLASTQPTDHANSGAAHDLASVPLAIADALNEISAPRFSMPQSTRVWHALRDPGAFAVPLRI
jgi:hypothetical protein